MSNCLQHLVTHLERYDNLYPGSVIREGSALINLNTSEKMLCACVLQVPRVVGDASESVVGLAQVLFSKERNL